MCFIRLLFDVRGRTLYTFMTFLFPFFFFCFFFVVNNIDVHFFLIKVCKLMLEQEKMFEDSVFSAQLVMRV